MLSKERQVLSTSTEDGSKSGVWDIKIIFTESELYGFIILFSETETYYVAQASPELTMQHSLAWKYIPSMYTFWILRRKRVSLDLTL